MNVSALEIAQLLVTWGQGDQAARDPLIPLVCQELRRLAHRYMTGERPEHTLQTTALVNEAYLRLVNCRRVRWQNRAHFFAVSAGLMRRILVDYARSRHCQRRGTGAQTVLLDAGPVPTEEPRHGGGRRGARNTGRLRSRKSKVVALKFFGGLTADEIAEVLQVSPQTVLRDWKLARSWLLRGVKRG